MSSSLFIWLFNDPFNSPSLSLSLTLTDKPIEFRFVFLQLFLGNGILEIMSIIDCYYELENAQSPPWVVNTSIAFHVLCS